MTKYEAIPRMSRHEVEAAIGRDRPEELLYAVLSAALYAEDGSWAQTVCLRLARHPDPNVRGNALLGFAHIARLHRALDRQALTSVVAGFQDPDPYVRGHALDAADDLRHFLGWHIPQPEVT